MGCEVSDAGVTLRFLDKEGKNEIRSRVFGKHARFESIVRPIEPESRDLRLGSNDWLSDVMVADGPTELKGLTPQDTGSENTSTCSMQVLVQWSVGGEEARRKNCICIAYGRRVGNEKKFLSVNHIDVLPADADLQPGHHLFTVWKNHRDFAVAANAKTPTEAKLMDPPDTNPYKD